MLDITYQDEGSLVVLYGASERGSSWLDESLPEEGMRWGRGHVVETRYALDIVRGAERDGLLLGAR